MQRHNDAMFGSSRLCKVSILQFFTKVKDTGLDQGVRSLHLLWAEGSLGIPERSTGIFFPLDGSDFRIEVASGRFTLRTMWPKVTTGSTWLNLSESLNLIEFADLVQRISEPRTSEPVTSGKLDI